VRVTLLTLQYRDIDRYRSFEGCPIAYYAVSNVAVRGKNEVPRVYMSGSVVDYVGTGER
jgi:hypothetical protein